LPMGDICPKCKKGRVYPTGKAQHQSDSNYPQITPIAKGESKWTEFTCDKCGQIVRELSDRDGANVIDDTSSINKK